MNLSRVADVEVAGNYLFEFEVHLKTFGASLYSSTALFIFDK